MSAALPIGAKQLQPQLHAPTISRLGENEKTNAKCENIFSRTVNIFSRTVNIFLNYVKQADGLKATFKVIYHGADWWKQLFGAVPSNIQNLRKLTNDGKNVISATEVPGKAFDIGRKLARVWKEKSLYSIKELVSSASQITGPLADGIKLAADKKIIDLTPKALSQVGFISNSGLAVGTTMSAYSEAKKVASLYSGFQHATSRRESRENAHQVAKHTFDGARFGSYAALGTVGVTGTLLGITFAPWVPLAFSTGALFFTIVGHFYTKFNHLDEKTGDLASKKA
ncbi:MAG TPA: hypothetical protein VLG49_07510 [Rhabdochlamydiaceae bacterium]|nr:hypothetical protein [Rhabdochlamydiaceae bacterium]